MKHVRKQASPQTFEQWKAQENEEWQPVYADLPNPEKAELHRSLLEEQGWVCCYCGRSIEQADSHIEHFRPQEHYSEQALDYTNLHASCIRATNPGTQLHCGHVKGNGFNGELALSPLQADCEQQFTYALDGQIIPGNNRAAYMRDLLKLDIDFLINRRAEQLRGVFDPDFLASANDDELSQLREAFRHSDQNGRLPEFGHVIARYAEQLMQGPDV